MELGERYLVLLGVVSRMLALFEPSMALFSEPMGLEKGSLRLPRSPVQESSEHDNIRTDQSPV